MGPLASLELPTHRHNPDLYVALLVVDGARGFIGSQNLIEPEYDKPGNHRRGLAWTDLMARVTGPVVRELAVVFATDWVAETGEDVPHTLRPVPSSDGTPAAVRGV